MCEWPADAIAMWEVMRNCWEVEEDLTESRRCLIALAYTRQQAAIQARPPPPCPSTTPPSLRRRISTQFLLPHPCLCMNCNPRYPAFLASPTFFVVLSQPDLISNLTHYKLHHLSISCPRTTVLALWRLGWSTRQCACRLTKVGLAWLVCPSWKK